MVDNGSRENTVTTLYIILYNFDVMISSSIVNSSVNWLTTSVSVLQSAGVKESKGKDKKFFPLTTLYYWLIVKSAYY